nr:hypothetical protein [Tanacetum cinerariifolium]
MAASAIIVSSDSSDESVGSPPSRVILFGDIPAVIPSISMVAPETSTTTPIISSTALVVGITLVASPTGLCGLVPYLDSDSDSPDEMDSPEHFTPLPATSPFLCIDSSEDSDSSDAPPSQDLYMTVIAHWRSKVQHQCILRGDSLERPRHSSSLSARPSQKRCRSPTDFVPSSTPVTGSLAPTRADLLPHRKRFRDSYSPKTSMEEDTEIDTTETEDGRELAIVDGDDVRDQVEVDPRDDREEFKASAGDTVVLRIYLRSVPRVDEEIVEPVGGDSSSSSSTRYGTVRSVEDMPVDLDDAIRNFYHHMSEVRMDRIVGIETTQRQLEADQMIASRERASMAESIRSLRSENLKIRDDRDDLWMSLRRLESFAERRLDSPHSLTVITMTNTRSGMTPTAIEEMINRHVTEALEAHEINRNLGLENLNGGNGNEPGGNGNGDGGNDNGQGGNGNGNGNGDGRGDRPVAHECTYQDFMKCQPLNFKGTEGVVGLIR